MTKGRRHFAISTFIYYALDFMQLNESLYLVPSCFRDLIHHNWYTDCNIKRRVGRNHKFLVPCLDFGSLQSNYDFHVLIHNIKKMEISQKILTKRRNSHPNSTYHDICNSYSCCFLTSAHIVTVFIIYRNTIHQFSRRKCARINLILEKNRVGGEVSTFSGLNDNIS